jgi:hypothetical protein
LDRIPLEGADLMRGRSGGGREEIATEEVGLREEEEEAVGGDVPAALSWSTEGVGDGEESTVMRAGEEAREGGREEVGGWERRFEVIREVVVGWMEEVTLEGECDGIGRWDL